MRSRYGMNKQLPDDTAIKAVLEPIAGYQEPWLLKVLLVEDDPLDVHWVTQTLKSIEEFECNICHASSVEDARTAIAANDFDVALLDYHLPDGHGDDVVKILEDKAGRCAAIMVSGGTMSEVSLFALGAGAVAAIGKDDLNPSLLETTIRFALRNQAVRRQVGVG